MNLVWHCEIDIVIIRKLIMCIYGIVINISIQLMISFNRLIFQKMRIILILILNNGYAQSTVVTLIINISIRLRN